MTEAADTRKSLAAAEKQLAEHRAKELAATAATRGRARFVVEVFENRDIKYLQGIASQIVASPGLVAVLGATGATSSLVIARSADVAVDVRPIGKDALAAIGGKGGGPANFIQGGGPGANVRDAMKLAEDRLAAALA
jgi:alanyl-tRNA synthetase